MSSVATMTNRLRRASLVQAVRYAEAAARLSGNRAELGRDALPAEEPARLAASDRMSLVADELADIQVDAGQVRLSANVLGLAGATPVLPPPYSELQLQRRRARDPSLSRFFNLIDHRALSFFYRIAQKFRWPLLAERAGRGERDPVQNMLVAFGGLGVDGVKERLNIPDAALVTLAAHLSDMRRSTASVETVLRLLIGLPLRIDEAWPVWMEVPEKEQTRLGGPCDQYSQLGDDPQISVGLGQAAMVGASVLDVQHHYIVEIGPLSYDELKDFCCRPERRALLSQLCVLAAGLEKRPSVRLLIGVDDIPRLRLGDGETPALLGWTTWLGAPDRATGTADDCVMPIDLAALR
jgi:type VI secretion system protein ImpH